MFHPSHISLLLHRSSESPHPCRGPLDPALLSFALSCSNVSSLYASKLGEFPPRFTYRPSISRNRVARHLARLQSAPGKDARHARRLAKMSGEPDFPPNLDDGELWLPSDVLSDDEDWNAVALAERLARSMIDDDDDNGTTKRTSMARSPNSTLCYAGGSAGSSDGSSLLSSPTENRSDAWDLLDVASGEAVRLKMREGLQKDFQGGDSNYFSIPSAWAYRDRHANASQLMQRSWSARTSRENPIFPAHQYRQLKHSSASGWRWTPAQLMQTSPGQKSAHSLRAPDCSYPPWPPMQVGGSGMRAIFLGPKGSGRESGGTGVFLPRGVGSASDPKKKPACSTVLLPSRVVQALNLNVEDIHSQPTMREFGNSKSGSSHGRKQLDHNGSIWNKPCYRVYSNIEAASTEITLPQDWTY